MSSDMTARTNGGGRSSSISGGGGGGGVTNPPPSTSAAAAVGVGCATPSTIINTIGASSNTTQPQPLTHLNHNSTQMSKADEIEIQVIDQTTDQPEIKRTSLGWICCAPCIWLRTSTTVHKIALSAATLLVTSLLVASPILFLISTAPSQLPRDCYVQEDDDCIPTPTSPPECLDDECRGAASSIQARMNWKIDPCKDFKSYTCSPVHSTLRAVNSAQENTFVQIQQLLIHNTTSGPFRRLGRLYGSCMRQKINSSTIRLFLDELGGYLPKGALGPSNIASLVSKLNEYGPIPIVEIYFDLSYGRKRQIMLIIDGQGTSPYVLENLVRFTGPKAPPYILKDEVPNLLDELLDQFLPQALAQDEKIAEKEIIEKFIKDLIQIRKYYIERDFANSQVMNNMTTLHTTYPFLNWSDLIASNWSGPIVVRSPVYLNKIRILLSEYQTRIVHNSLLVLFALSALPSSQPSPEVCTKATMWALPQVTSSLYMGQFPEEYVRDSIQRTENIFESLKSHLKRAPSLRGTALVKLSSLKMQANQWPVLYNVTKSTEILDKLEISSDNYFENIIKIYKLRKSNLQLNMPTETQTAYAYPPVSKPFYDNFSHSIVVPLSLILIPYFNIKLPIYMHYATVGVQLGREILRSITKAFDDKAMRCVPSSIDIFSNSSRMEILIYSGGMQIAYHSLLSLTGPLKGLDRLPALNLTPTQLFFLLVAQEMCINAMYDGIDSKSPDFDEILTWLVAQGGSANEVFHCPYGSSMRNQKTCSVL